MINIGKKVNIQKVNIQKKVNIRKKGEHSKGEQSQSYNILITDIVHKARKISKKNIFIHYKFTMVKVDNSDKKAMSVRRNRTVDLYTPRITDPSFTWEVLIADLEDVREEKTRKGEYKYTSVVDFERFIERKASFYDINVSGDEDAFIAWYVRNHPDKGKNTFQPSVEWHEDRLEYLRQLELCSDETLRVRGEISAKGHKKYTKDVRRVWDVVYTMLSDIVQILKKLPGENGLIVCSDKAPIDQHKWDDSKDRYQYTIGDFERGLNNGDIKKLYEANVNIRFGILCSSIVCFDFDTPESYVQAKREGILEGGVVELTRGGVHVYFLQTEDTIAIVHNQLRIKPSVDFIAISTSCHSKTPLIEKRTRSNIVVSPSQGYVLLDSFENIKNITDEGFRWWLDNATSKNAIQSGIDYETEDKTFVGIVEQKYVAKLLNVVKTSSDWLSYYFKRTGDGECPDGKVHDSNNFYVNVSPTGAAFYKCLSCSGSRQTLISIPHCSFINENETEQTNTEQEAVFAKSFNKDKFLELIKKLNADGNHSQESIEIILKEFSKYHVFVSGSSSFIIEVRYTRPGVPATNNIISYEVFCSSYTVSFDIFPDGKSKSFSKTWIKYSDSNGLSAVELAFEPERPPGLFVNTTNDVRYYNMWCGLKAIRDYDMSTVDLVNKRGYLDLILLNLRNLCNGEEADYLRVVKWLAKMFRGEKTGMCPAFYKSPEGCGKSTFWSRFIMEWVLGQEICFSTSDGNKLFGKFNASSIDNMLFALWDEPKITAEMLEPFKYVVSETYISVEGKHTNQKKIRSKINIVITSNEPLGGLMHGRRMIPMTPTSVLKKSQELDKLWEFTSAEERHSHHFENSRMTAANFVKHVFDIDQQYPDIRIDDIPARMYVANILRADPHIQCISATYEDMRKLLASDKRNKLLKQQDVIDIVHNEFVSRSFNTDFDHGKCHDYLLDLGFKERSKRDGPRNVNSYEMPDEDTFEAKIKLKER